jgi:hypothetical protein
MDWSSKLSLFVIATALGGSCDRSIADAPVAASAPNSDTQIYETFLDGWTGKEHAPINVSRVAAQPQAREIGEYTDCAKQDQGKPIHWTTSATGKDLGDVILHLSYVHFVDPDKWHPDDPRNHMAKGESVDSAVSAGFAHGLLTLSAISYDESRTTAAFTYGFVCGGLCGNGGVVLFKKSTKGWTRSTRSCGGWMS